MSIKRVFILWKGIIFLVGYGSGIFFLEGLFFKLSAVKKRCALKYLQIEETLYLVITCDLCFASVFIPNQTGPLDTQLRMIRIHQKYI